MTRKARLLAACAVVLTLPAARTTAADGDTIVLGAAVSLTGKYSVNGKNTKDGYDLGVKRVNQMGGVKLGGKSRQLKVVYYDDESTPARAAQLTERLISQDGVSVQFRKKCFQCGHEDACRSSMLIGNGTSRASFYCKKCRKNRDVEIRGMSQ